MLGNFCLQLLPEKLQDMLYSVTRPDPVITGQKDYLDWEDLAKAAHFNSNELAKLCCVSLRTLQRYFSRNDLQVASWLRQLRLKNAREDLLMGKTIKEAALEAGYRELSNFSRDFKKAYGASPRFFFPRITLPPSVVIRLNQSKGPTAA